MGDSLVDSSHPFEDKTKVVVRAGPNGGTPESLRRRADGFFAGAFLVECVSQLKVNIREGRVQLESLAVVTDGFLQGGLFDERVIAQVPVRRGFGPRDRQRM